MKKNRALIIFSGIIVVLSLAYFLMVYDPRGVKIPKGGWMHDVAEGIGTMGLWGICLIYGRTALKMAMGSGGLLSRVVPDLYYDPAMSVARKTLFYLNKTHKYVGVATIVVIVLHAALVRLPVSNLFLKLVLVLLLWQGLFGIFLVVRYPPNTLKKVWHLAHAQLFSGVMIGVFAAFGHLLLGD